MLVSTAIGCRLPSPGEQPSLQEGSAEDFSFTQGVGSRLVGGSLKRDSKSVKVQMSVFAVSIFTGKRRVSRKTFIRFFGAGGDENTSEKR